MMILKVMFVREALDQRITDLKFSLWRTVCRFFYLSVSFFGTFVVSINGSLCGDFALCFFLNVLKPSGLTVESFLKVCGTHFTGVSVENAFWCLLTVTDLVSGCVVLTILFFDGYLCVDVWSCNFIVISVMRFIVCLEKQRNRCFCTRKLVMQQNLMKQILKKNHLKKNHLKKQVLE